MQLKATCMVLKGISVAYLLASSMACLRAETCSVLSFGNPKASMILSNARVSSSTKKSNSSLIFCPLSAQGENSPTRSSQPLFEALKLATMVPKEAPKAPDNAAMLPPPGAGLSEAVSSANDFTVIETNFDFLGSFRIYSMIFF